MDDFARLSGQLDQLRDLLTATPRVQHITDMSGQMGLIANRLGHLEDVMRQSANTPSMDTLSQQLTQQLGNRLADLQSQVERLDPSDRLLHLEDQFAALADRLENSRELESISQPINILARQMESLVTMIDRQDQNGQSEALELLAQRIVDLDERLQDNSGVAASGFSTNAQHFDHVERTLARIDDVLAQRMESTDLSGIEDGLSRLADRVEAQKWPCVRCPHK